MRTKARDIIPGWPRGRSTDYKHRIYLYHDEWPLLNRLSQEMHDQLDIERVYHQMQQAMVNEWFARYRLGDHTFQKQVYPNLVPSNRVNELVEKGVLIWKWYVGDNEPIDHLKKHLQTWQEP